MKKNLIITLSAIILMSATGCSNKNYTTTTVEQNVLNVTDISNIKIDTPIKFELEDTSDENGFRKVKGYNNLDVFTVEDNIINSKYIHLSSYSENPKYNYNTAEKIKSLLGENLDLVADNSSYFVVPDVYFLKGYEADTSEGAIEQKSIYLALQEDIPEDEYLNPPSEKIGFEASSRTSEKALKTMLSMEDKISTMLNNLLSKEEADEVLQFLKEEISRNYSFPEDESSFTIRINSDLHLEYIYTYSEEDNMYYNRLSLYSEYPMASFLEEINTQN